jgi:CCR4-NOT transcriptional regulation complex NOT5 subunit
MMKTLKEKLDAFEKVYERLVARDNVPHRLS